ncbi:MAG: FAD-dependent oxidoreductase [Candidatus Micrarchaeota archaeon]|nr:FAD-dependent oxidoreductase [Candidatus Micrarchaeota archaeon]MDE1864438.1 FAD-dependent oxidoreductase [Candidatus Micrarchaeota archaeon]
MEKHYEVVIVGGGIIGTSILYTLSNFSSVKSMLLLEKRGFVGEGTSKSSSNSQTLHVGDIETNYTMEKVIATKAASELILKYVKTLGKAEAKSMISPVSKMVLGVGESEIEAIEKRCDRKFLEVFPHIHLLRKSQIGVVEPFIIKGREHSEKILAAHSREGNMVNFELLSRSFVSHLPKGKNAKISFNDEVISIEESRGIYRLTTTKGIYTADFVLFAAGGYSLYFAKSLGYGNDLSLLSVGGNFYYSKRVLNGKVYRVQKGHIPFAAVHGDPDLDYPRRTRFGPTVNILPYMEKGAPSSAYKYFKAVGVDERTIESLLKITADKDLLEIVAKNLLYAIPDIGTYLFLKEEVNKIVPSLRYDDLHFFKEGGGVRPQIIDKKKMSLVLGVVDIKGEGIEFNMAPSPGASACLKEALSSSLYITKSLGERFHKEAYSKIFCSDESEWKLLTQG